MAKKLKQLLTKWGKQVEGALVHQEHPRPIFKREQTRILNGNWDYSIYNAQEEVIKSGQILVPYPPESHLSGVGHILQADESLVYKHTLELQPTADNRTIIHFGAVDQECELLVNGQPVGSHKGGYLPFSFDITSHLVDGQNELELRVKDMTEFAPHARGKQRLHAEGAYSFLFYTPVSGIWKSVWLEEVPNNYIKDFSITPDIDSGKIDVLVETTQAASVNVKIYEAGEVICDESVEANSVTSLSIPAAQLWSPESPFLYDIEFAYGEDVVSSYFGMRKYSVEKDAQGISRFHLNNQPYYFNGLLNQGYWPESILTAPTDEALLYDIVRLKELGFNTIRVHVKVEAERFYYHCDKVGMIVWQDMPNGGGVYDHDFVTDLPNDSDEACRTTPDGDYAKFSREDEVGRAQYYQDLEDMVKVLYNHPSIALWVPFNEGWGQFDANKATDLVRSIDSSRFIMETSGWFDQGGGDVHSYHNYRHFLKVQPQGDRPVALSEFGGYSAVVENHHSHSVTYGYQAYDNLDELTQNYRDLIEQQIIPNIENGLSATIYTQLTDVEVETNGLFTYDREVQKIHEEDLSELNQRIYQTFEESV